jgi:threonine/homoserine/homoserine lactone efflux protein
MNSLTFLEQFEELATAKPEPPYVLLIAGFLIITICISPLVIAIKQRVTYWSKNLSPGDLPTGGRIQIILPFSGVAGGLCIFLAAALEVLGLPVIPALFFSLLFTVLAGYLTWFQLGKLLSRRVVRSYLEQFFA